ncbi:MAG: MFS transporter [Chloroflexi bacterium]|nr:MFS transporter [Chloroflexota bacterium]
MAGPQRANPRTTAQLVASVSAFQTPFMFSAVNVALPPIGKDLGMDAVMLGWVTTAYLLSTAVLMVPFGRMADIHGRKKVFLIGASLFALASFLLAVAGSGTMLIYFRVLQGVASAMISGTGLAILTSIFPPGERGKALGINTASVYVGLTAGPLLGGVLTRSFGWRSVFFVAMLLALVVVVLVLLKLKGEWAGAKGQEFDLTGAVVYGLALVTLMYGSSNLPSVVGFGLVLAGIVGIVVFVWWETRVSSPILDIRIFKGNPVFLFSILAALINYLTTSGVGFLLTLYLQYIKGLDPRAAGLVLVSQPAVMALVSPFAGRLSDKFEPRVLASVGIGMTGAGLVMLVFLGADTPVWFLVGVLLLQGLGFGLFSSPNTNAVVSSVDKNYYGVASATLGTVRHTSQVLSMAIVLFLFALYLGPVEVAPEHFESLMTVSRVAFAIFAALSFFGVLASLKRGKIR